MGMRLHMDTSLRRSLGFAGLGGMTFSSRSMEFAVLAPPLLDVKFALCFRMLAMSLLRWTRFCL